MPADFALIPFLRGSSVRAAGPEEGPKDDQGVRAPLLCRKAERDEAVQCTEEKVLGEPHCSLSVLEGDL